MIDYLFPAAIVGLLLAGVILAYTYLGYPLLVRILAWCRPRPVHRVPIEPSVSFIIAAFNEEKDIAAKLENTLALEYPREKLEIVVASDGSTDGTHEIVQAYVDRGVRLFTPGKHLGKTGTANAVVPTTHGEILVFSDATGKYNHEALRALVANFADPTVGAVAGRVVYAYGQGAAAHGFATYQRFVVPQRQAESRFGSETSISGSIHAVRRVLFHPAPPHLSYDMVHPLHVAQAGYRSVYEDNAISLEKARTDVAEEYRCRVRLAVRSYSYVPYLLKRLMHCPDRLFVFQVVSHKLLRWISPILLVLAVVSATILASRGGMWVLPFLGVCTLVLIALLGWAASKRGKSSRLLAAPLFYCTINLAFLVGFLRFLGGIRMAGWKTER